MLTIIPQALFRAPAAPPSEPERTEQRSEQDNDGIRDQGQ
jgi:hypothetical protein